MYSFAWHPSLEKVCSLFHKACGSINFLFFLKWILWIGWIVSALLLFGSIWGNYPLQQLDKTTPAIFKGLYHAIPRVAWPVALSFIVFACHFGYGGIINWFLSLPQWQPLSRLTYSTYITHTSILLLVERQIRTSRYISDLIAVIIQQICNQLFHIETLGAFIFFSSTRSVDMWFWPLWSDICFLWPSNIRFSFWKNTCSEGK